MSSTVKLWELKNTKNDEVLGYLDTWDLGQILAKRLQLEEFSLLPAEVKARLLPPEEVHGKSDD